MNGNDILNGMEHIDPKLIESAEKIKPRSEEHSLNSSHYQQSRMPSSA